MKRIHILLAILALTLLTACVKGNYELKINKDGSGESVVTIGFEEEAYERLGERGHSMVESATEELFTQGYNVESYNEEGYIGFQATKSFEDVREAENLQATGGMTEMGVGAALSDNIDMTVEEGVFTDMYKIEAVVDLENSGLLGGMQQLVSNQLDLTFTLDLPVSPKAHNADAVDGNELTWNIKTAGTTNMMVQVGVPNVRNIVIAGVAGLVIAAVVVFLILRKRNKNRDHPST
ncbi:EGFR-like transmembrane domain-containing protein [Halobacillus mangrovi]|uniref:LppM domain-containing protein n=1 Tax=Halobacillus mangrovi TaxID=402384 RepID=A0A1W5ZR00_9BACI|nr:transmembrane domain-containing protein [Halobacillus mangrovi]ARI75702.1 hypothetical protein HM131_02155 [Halobacillus mangrovi]